MSEPSRDWTKFGRYALLEKIGSGGMAEIYRAKTFGAAGFEKEYAIKLIIPSLVDDTEFVEMFINEAKLVVNLYHANIVQVFDLGEIDDQYYIAMEYVHGKDLLEILARCAQEQIKIPLNLVLFITMEMLKGLNFAHTAKDPYGEQLNIIHRDISPSNVMLSYAGDVKLGDFGVAKAAVKRSMTQSGTLKGKVGYMSPEQVMGKDIDSRSDIFSAGIVFFEALSMSRLFVGDSDLDVMLKVRDANIDEALERAQPIPSDLERIVRRALAKDPDDRFQTAEAFYQELVDFCYENGIKVTGNDLSNMMRRLFAEQIEQEKDRRKQDPRIGPSQLEEASNPSPSEIIEEEPVEQTGTQRTPVSSPGLERRAIEDAPATPRGSGADGAGIIKPSTAKAAEKAANRKTDSSGANDEAGDDASESDRTYHFRDPGGSVHGPMDTDKIVALLSSRPHDSRNRVSVDGGPWQSPVEIDRLAEILKHQPSADEQRAARHEDFPAGAQIFESDDVGLASDTYEEGPEAASSHVADDSGDSREDDEPDAAGDIEDAQPIPGPEEDKDHSSDAFASTHQEGEQIDRNTVSNDELGDTDVHEQARSPEGGGDADTTADDSDEPPSGPDEPDTSPGRASTESEVVEKHAGHNVQPPGSLGHSSTMSEATEDGARSGSESFEDQYASYEGNLEHSPFPRLLARLHFGDATGRLFVQRGAIRKSIYLRDGEPILVDSNKQEELLGSFLKSKDIITQDQLDRALARLDEWGGRLGDALVAIGAIPAHDIYELLSDQMRVKLLDIFSWRTGYYGYYENQEPDTKGYPLGVDALDITVEGCRSDVPFGHLVDFYDDRMNVQMYYYENSPVDADRLQLSTRELRILNQIQSRTTLSELLELMPSEDKNLVYRMVFLLHQVEMIGFDDTMEKPLPGKGAEDF